MSLKTLHSLACLCVRHAIQKTERYGHIVYLGAGSMETHFWVASTCQFCLVIALLHEGHKMFYGNIEENIDEEL